MIERKFLSQRLKEFQVQRYIAEKLTNSGQCAVEIKRTPMGEKVIVYTTRPGVVIWANTGYVGGRGPCIAAADRSRRRVARCPIAGGGG